MQHLSHLLREPQGGEPQGYYENHKAEMKAAASKQAAEHNAKGK
jgi:hypothetical protein